MHRRARGARRAEAGGRAAGGGGEGGRRPNCAADGRGFALLPTERWAQSRAYVERVAAAAGLSSAVCDDIVVRMDLCRPIAGYLFALTKPLATGK